MHGHMGIGASPIARTTQLNNGSMGVGSTSGGKRQKSDVEKELEIDSEQDLETPETESVEETTEKESVDEKQPDSDQSDVEKTEDETVDEDESDYSLMHHSKLKRIAVEKGYEGDKFDKQTLLEFLTSKTDE